MQTLSSSSSFPSPLQQQDKEKQDVSLIKDIVDDNSLTFAEKIISIKNVETYSKKSAIISRSGDSTGPLAIRSLNEMGIEDLHDPAKVLLVIDHTFPAADEKVANLHAMMREFASKHNCRLVEGMPGRLYWRLCVWYWEYRGSSSLGYRVVVGGYPKP